MKYLGLLLALIIFSCKAQSLDEKISNDKSQLAIELNKMLVNDQLYRNMIDNYDKKEIGVVLFRKKYDSLMALQSKIDYANTKRLIEITEEYGFPNPQRLGEPLGAWIIFHHSPSSYFATLEKLLKKENEEKRLFDNEYHMIKWHLTGRKGIPFIPGVEVIDARHKDKDSTNN